jgi:hypothetical protein
MATREAVVKTLAVFGSLFPRDITPELVTIYHAALEDVTDPELTVAMAKCVKTAKFFPQPAELRDAVGANERSALPDVAGICERIRGLVTHSAGYGESMPSVERVRQVLGDAIADAYGFVGPQRLEGVIFRGSGTGVDIARREFSDHLYAAQKDGQNIALPAPHATPLLNAGAFTLPDAPRGGGFKRLAPAVPQPEPAP